MATITATMALFAVAGLLVALSWAAATTQLSEHTSCSSVSLADSCESYLNSSTTTDSPPSSCCVSVRSSRLCFCSLDDNSQEDFLKLATDCGITFSANCSSSSSNSSSSSSSSSISISPASPSTSPTAPSPSTEPTPADATRTTPADSGSHTPSITTPDQEKRKQLDWSRRYKIIEGIARGLLYLHEDSRHRIVHRDLKAANILLDANMIPKISDFGTARLVHIDKSWMETSQIAGTRGYMAPEYVLDGQYSAKSDVYSFGVLILEIISGSRRVRSSDQSGMPQDLLNDAWNCWSDGEALKFMDETLASSYYSSTEVMKCIQLGLLCVQPNPDERPATASAVNTLNNITTIILPEPQQPLCFNTLVAESSSNSSAKWTTTYSSEVTNP